MSNPLAEINVGVVGTGFMGVAHTEALRRLGVNVIGVVGSTPQRAQAKADAANLPRVFASLDALLAEPSLHAVHITSPNDSHFEQSMAVLRAGKHVICEKPLAMNAEQTALLLAAAQSSGLVHSVCFNQRYYPLVHQAQAMVASGELGVPRLISGGYLQDWLLLDTDWNWRLVAAKAGELRAVADIGSHWFDNVQFITGARITEVFADLHTFVPTRNHPIGEVETFSAHSVGEVERIEEAVASDDAAGLLLRFDNGARGVCTLSQVSAGRKNAMHWEVDCSQSTVAWNQESPEELWVGHRGRSNEIVKRDPGLMYPSAAGIAAYPAGHVEGYPDTFRGLFATIYADIVNHRVTGAASVHPNYPTFADGHDAVLVCEAVARSAATGTWATVARS
jgi:predicted dehydrogenase